MTSRRSRIALVAAFVLAILAPLAAQADLATYTQDFELLIQPDTAALANDGWVVFGNVFDPTGTTYLYGYGTFVAPNDGFAFCQIDVGQGGVEQGFQQLAVFSDYNNADHANGNLIESNVFQEQTIGAADVGSTWKFSFQCKKGNIEGSSTALAFIKTLDPMSGYATTNLVTVDMTAVPDTWGGYSLTLPIDASLVGQLFQFGFANTATFYQGSAIFYDNIVFEQDDLSSVPDAEALAGATLGRNYPNPFNPSTRIDFSLEKAGHAELSVYDMAGRLVATLHDGALAAGPHQVTWTGTTNAGTAAPSGRYSYVLRTATGSLAGAMTLLK